MRTRTSSRIRSAKSSAGETNSRGISRIHLLGTMRANGSHGANILPKSKKTQAVLAFLCLSTGQHVSRSQLAGLIWTESPEAYARDNLRQALNELERTGGNWRIERRRHTIRLDTAECWIDAFESPDRPDQLLEGLYGISTAFDQWLVGERVRFENRWQTALEQELNDVTANNAAPQARAAAARKLLNFVSAHDPAVRALMSAYMEMDDRALAIREYERFRELVDRTLGTRPSEKTVALYEEIRRGGKRVRLPQIAAKITDETIDKASGLLEDAPHRGGSAAPCTNS